MIFEKVTDIYQIREGDFLLVEANNKVQHFHCKKVKMSVQDGTEIILNKKTNTYFNLGKYLEGRSWVKDLYIVKLK